MNCKNNLNEFFLGIANATFMNYENAEGQEMDEKELLVIIPAYNEEKNIGFVLDELEKPEIAGIADVLIMNDASSVIGQYKLGSEGARSCSCHTCI